MGNVPVQQTFIPNQAIKKMHHSVHLQRITFNWFKHILPFGNTK